MSPEEFITYKKREFGPIAHHSKEDRMKIINDMQLPQEDVDAFLKAKIDEDFLEFLFRVNKFRISQPILSLLKQGKLALGEINIQTPNAHYYKVGTDGYAITFNVGLRAFIYRIIRAYSTRFTFQAENETQISFGETCQKIADIYWWYLVSGGYSIGPDYPITRDQIVLANKMTIECEFFFLAHELGHLVLDLTDTSELNNLSALDQEIAADSIGLNMCLSGLTSTKANPIDLVYASIEIAFMIFDGLAKLGFEIEDHIHPKAASRIQNLRKILKRNFPNDYKKIQQMSNLNEKIFTNVISVVSGEDKTYGDFFNETAINFSRDIHKLLQRCSNNIVPDYATFNVEMSHLFAKGYSHILLRIADDVVVKLEESYPSPDLVTFNMYKLFLSFSDALMEPVKSIFKEKLKLKPR